VSPVDRSRLPVPGTSPSYRFPEVRKVRLPNGLCVWTVEHRSVPVVTLVLLVGVGSAADPAARPGLASLTGDMLDEGAGDRSALEVHDALARIGASFDTEVGPDATLLTLTTLDRFRQRGLRLLADLVLRPRFDPDEFERVRQLRANRLRQLRDLPPALADRAFASLLYGSHPYGHLAIGSEDALQQIALEDVRQYHRRAYRPSAITLVAVGDASHEQLLADASEAFGHWPESDPDPTIAEALARALQPPAAAPARLALVDRPGAAQSELRLGHVAVPRSTPDYHALVLLNMVLGGQFVSRINMNLREGKGFTYGARTSFDFRRGPGPFQLQVSVQTAATAQAIHESFDEIAAIRGPRPVSSDELALGVAALTRGYARNFETAEQIARAATQIALYDLPDDYFAEFVPRVERVTADDVTRVSAQHLDPSRLTTLVVGDYDTIANDLGRLELGIPSVLSADVF